MPPTMSDVFVADQIAPRFELPTAEERAVIEHFAGRSSALQTFGRLVATGMADISNNLEATFTIVERIFDSLNSAIENEISLIVRESKPWTEGSFQPRILARSIDSIKELGDFIYMGFGSPSLTSDGEDSWKIAKSLPEFMYKAFLLESNIVKISETPPSVSFAIDNFYLDSSIKDNYHKRPTHALIMQDQSGVWQQRLARIDSNYVINFIECIMNDDWQNLPKFGKLLKQKRSRRAFIDQIRNNHRFVKSDFQRSFSYSYDTTHFYKSLEYDSKVVVYSNDLEIRIFEKIIKLNLESNKTDNHDQRRHDRHLNIDQMGSDPSEHVRRKLDKIDAFIESNPGIPVSGLILELFPELNYLEEEVEISLPTVAPAMWPKDRGTVEGALETPPQFIKRVYEPWLGKGLTTADVRRLDEPLMQAHYYWCRKHGTPSDLDLPTKEQTNDRALAKARDGATGALKVSGAFTLKEAQRLYQAERRRAVKDANSPS